MIRRFMLGSCVASAAAFLAYLPAGVLFHSIFGFEHFGMVVVTLLVTYPIGAALGVIICEKYFFKNRVKLTFAMCSLLGGLSTGLVALFLLIKSWEAAVMLCPIGTGVSSSLLYVALSSILEKRRGLYGKRGLERSGEQHP